MRALLLVLALGTSVVIVYEALWEFAAEAAAERGYLGFDRNDYPGDANLKALSQRFFYSGYWLNNPPGTNSNSWTGKRKTLEQEGFGFLVVFNGRTDAEIKAAADAATLGSSDGAAAVSAARREGFPSQTVIFLDQEEGGRLLPEQRVYLHAWADRVTSVGFSAGVYCSGIAAQEASGASVVTASDIRENAQGRRLKYWIVNDTCPPSPGCAPRENLFPTYTGIFFAEVWQFAQSPRRPAFATGCSGYNNDRNCYLPGVNPIPRLRVDLDIATSSDPSRGRSSN
jgi:hypothetical protein